MKRGALGDAGRRFDRVPVPVLERPVVEDTDDLIDRHQLLLIEQLIRVGRDQPLVKQLLERLGRRHLPKIKQHLVPEPRIQQVQHRVLRATDVQIHPARLGQLLRERAELLDLRPLHALPGRQHPRPLRVPTHEPVRVLRIAIPQVIPARARPPRHRVRLATHHRVRRQTLHAGLARRRRHPVLRLRQQRLRVVALLRLIILHRRQHHRQRLLAHAVVEPALVKHDRERLAPVPLPAEQPVAQPIVHLPPALPLFLQPVDDLTLRVFLALPIEETRVHRRTVARVRLPVEILRGPHRPHDRQPERLGELPVPLVLPRHRHDRARAIPHQHVVRHPHRDRLPRHRVDRAHPQRHARLVLALLPLDVAPVPRHLHVPSHRVVIALRVRHAQHRVHQRVLRRHHHKSRPEQRVGPRREHPQRDPLKPRRRVLERKVNVRPLALADPLRLLDPRRRGPVEVVQVTQQPVRIRRDPELPLTQRLPQHREAAPLAPPVDHFLIRQRRPQLGAPVHRLLADIRQPVRIDDRPLRLFIELRPRELLTPGRPHLAVLARVRVEHRGPFPALQFLDQLRDRPPPLGRHVVPRVVDLEKDPLRPPVIPLVDRPELARPVVAEAEPLQLTPEVVDRLLRRHLGVHPRLDRVLLGRQAERVPPHRVQHVEPAHPLVPAQNIRRRVPLRVPHVQARPARIREHVQAIKLRSRPVPPLFARVRLLERPQPIPHALPPRLDLTRQRRGVPMPLIRLYRHRHAPDRSNQVNRRRQPGGTGSI